MGFMDFPETALDRPVTLLIGDDSSGTSRLLEMVATRAGAVSEDAARFLDAEATIDAHGLRVLDEPEVGLSIPDQLTLARRIHTLARQGAQFVIATDSPILLALPDARIYDLTDGGAKPIDYPDTEQYQLASAFLEDPARLLRSFLDA